MKLSEQASLEEVTFPVRVERPEILDATDPRSLRRNQRGYPMAYTTWVDENGVEDPCLNEWRRIAFACRYRLCGICGEPLPPGELLCFVGDAEQMRNGLFYDPAMHPNCARFAFVKCPFLANRAWKPMGSRVSRRVRPECMYIYWTNDFKRQWLRPLFRRGEYRWLRVIKAGEAVRIERRTDRLN